MRDREVVASKVVKAFYDVYNTLGYGFLEKVYENALVMELRERDLFVQQQQATPVYFKGVQVGDYYVDLLVENCLVLELKAVEKIVIEHEAQLLNYLRASDYSLGLLLNFGVQPQIKRKIYETARSPQAVIAETCDEVSEHS